MASNVILTLQTKYDGGGAAKLKQDLNEVESKMRQTAQSAKDVSSTLGDLKNVAIGAVLALPLAGFVKEAIDSEKVMQRFSMSLEAFNSNINDVDIEALTKKAHNFGMTQTEMVTALSQNLPLFKSYSKEMNMMDTAMGMARFSGRSLADTLRTLGYTIEYGPNRMVRQFGVSMHSEIRNKAERTAAVIKDLTDKFSRFAVSTGTAADELKKAGASIKDIGESVGSMFVKSIGDAAREWNKLPDSFKEIIVIGGLATTTILGITAALSGLTGMIGKTIIALKGLGLALGVTGGAIALAFVGATAGITAFIAGNMVAGKQLETNRKKIAEYKAALEDKPKVATIDVGEGEKFVDKLDLSEQALDRLEKRLKLIKELTSKNKFELAFKLILPGAGGKEIRDIYKDIGKEVKDGAKQLETALAIIETKRIIEGQKKEYDYLKKHNISSLQEYDSFYKKMESLRIASMTDANEKELAQMRYNLLNEKQEMIKAHGGAMDVRLAITRAALEKEAQLYKSQMDKEKEYALMSAEEQMQYDNDYAAAKAALRRKSSMEDVSKSSDELKDSLKRAGGAKALEEREIEWAREKAVAADKERNLQTEARALEDIQRLRRENKDLSEEELLIEEQKIKDKAEMSLAREKAGVEELKYFTEAKPITDEKLSPEFNINITPSSEEIARIVGEKVAEKYQAYIDKLAQDSENFNVAKAGHF